MTIHPRVARTIVLLAWAGFLGGIWFTGETARYLGPWTWWVVPFGAATLAAATLASGVSALRSRRERKLTRMGVPSKSKASRRRFSM